MKPRPVSETNTPRNGGVLTVTVYEDGSACSVWIPNGRQ